jgi:predicted amidophosphoribosyltransferase
MKQSRYELSSGGSYLEAGMAETQLQRINRLYKRCPQCDRRLDRKNRILCERCEKDEILKEKSRLGYGDSRG